MIIEFNKVLFNKQLTTFTFFNDDAPEDIDFIVQIGGDGLLWDDGSELLFDNGLNILT